MTENEAKAFLKIEKECINRNCDRNCAKCDIVQKVEDLNSAYDTAIKALEEVQQYRQIGTVEDFRLLKGKQIAKKPLDKWDMNKKRIRTMTISQIYDRKDDLLVSGNDIREVAVHERRKAIDDFARKLCKAFDETDLNDNGYYPNNIVRRVAEELKNGVAENR